MRLVLIKERLKRKYEKPSKKEEEETNKASFELAKKEEQHVHQFIEEYNEKTNLWRRSCTCGFSNDFEKI